MCITPWFGNYLNGLSIQISGEYVRTLPTPGTDCAAMPALRYLCCDAFTAMFTLLPMPYCLRCHNACIGCNGCVTTSPTVVAFQNRSTRAVSVGTGVMRGVTRLLRLVIV